MIWATVNFAAGKATVVYDPPDFNVRVVYSICTSIGRYARDGERTDSADFVRVCCFAVATPHYGMATSGAPLTKARYWLGGDEE